MKSKQKITRKIYSAILLCYATCAVQFAQAQNGGDSITPINCPGADTILSCMVVSDNGIIHYTTNRETGIYNTVTGQKLNRSGSHSVFLKDSHNHFWTAQQNRVIKEDERGKQIEVLAIPANDMQSGAKINDVAIDRKNNIWLATSSGVLVKTKEGWLHYTTGNSALLSNHIYSVNIDNQNNKWIISDSGIIILGDTICASGKAWKRLSSSMDSTISINIGSVSSILFDKNNTALICTYHGMIIRCQQGVIDTLPICKAGGLNMPISSLAFDQYGNIWAGTWGNGLLKISPDGTSYIAYTTSNSNLGYDYINAVFAAKDSSLYVGTSSKGIYKVKPSGSSSNGAENVQIKKPVQTETTNAIEVFPNPSSGIFNISASQPGSYQVDVQDINGKTIRAFHNYTVAQNTSLDLSGLSPAMYVLYFYSSNTASYTVKITIQK